MSTGGGQGEDAIDGIYRGRDREFWYAVTGTLDKSDGVVAVVSGHVSICSLFGMTDRNANAKFGHGGNRITETGGAPVRRLSRLLYVSPDTPVTEDMGGECPPPLSPPYCLSFATVLTHPDPFRISWARGSRIFQFSLAALQSATAAKRKPSVKSWVRMEDHSVIDGITIDDSFGM